MMKICRFVLLLPLVLAACTPAIGGPAASKSIPAPNASGPEVSTVPVFISSFGDTGDASAKLSNPIGIGLDKDGNSYVSDRSGVHKFDRSGKAVTFTIADANRPALAAGLTVDSQGNIFVADAGAHEVKKYNAQGQLVGKIGAQGDGDGQFNTPIDVTTDRSDNLYVVDQGNRRVQKFDTTGKFLLKFGRQGQKNGEFSTPRGIAVDSQGNIYVSDLGDPLFQKFDATGKFLDKFGYSHTGENLWKTSGLAVDSNDNVYIAESFNQRIQKFSSTGRFLWEFGQGGPDKGQFRRPEDIAVDAQGTLYVADAGNNRIDKFGKP